MALEDLLGSIESFDYSQVGQPQSFEVNGSVVTGQQSFERPLEEPLPIQEIIVGYGLRSLLSAPRGFNFFSDDRATGFTPNLIPAGGDGPGTTQFVDLSDSLSTFNHTITHNDLTFRYSNDVLTPNEGSGDFQPVVITPGGTTFEWPAVDNAYAVDFFPNDFAMGFTKNWLDSTSDGPGQSQFQGVDGNLNQYGLVSSTYGEDYVSQVTQTIPNPFGGSTESTTNIVNLENPIVFQGNKNLQMTNDYFHGLGDTPFRREAGRIVNWLDEPSNFVKETENEDGNIDYHLHTDYMTNHTVVAQADTTGKQIVISPGRHAISYPTDYTSVSIPGGEKGDMVIEPGDGLDRFAKFLSDSDWTDSGRVMKIPVDGEGRAIDGKSSISDPLKIGDGFVDYIQKMSGGNSQPFIVRRPGNDYGFDSMPDLGPSVAQNLIEGTGKIVNFLDEIAGGFVRGTPTFSGRIAREIDDIFRKGKFILTTEGITFSIKQFFLQANNRTIETRIWNPASLLSTPDFIKIPRHLGSIEYEGLMKNPVKTLEEAVPSFIPEIITSKLLDMVSGTTPDGVPTSRVSEQVGWIKNRNTRFGAIPEDPAPQEGESPTENTPEQDASIPKSRPTAKEYYEKIKTTINNLPKNLTSGAASLLAGAMPDVGVISLAFHNPNHTFRLRTFGLFDIYGGPNAGDPIKEVEQLKKDLETGGDLPNKTITFLDTGSKIEEHYKKYNYRYLTYGALVDGSKYEQDKKSPIDGKHQEGTRNVGMTPDVPLDKIENPDGSLTPLGVNLMLRNTQKDYMDIHNTHDRVNAFPITETNNIPVDFVDFRFQTRQFFNGSTTKPRTIVFRASLNNVNENVQPNYNEIKYLGRPEKFYVYDGVDRDINIDFTLYPKTAQEFPFLTEKLNYLVGLAYPQYTDTGLMIPPYVDLTLGDMFRRQPGYISNLAINVQDNTTWETEWFQFPKHITATLTFRYIGRHKPTQFGKHYDLPWLNNIVEAGKHTGVTLHAEPTMRKGSATGLKSIVNREDPKKSMTSEDNTQKIQSGWNESVLDNLTYYDAQVNKRPPGQGSEQTTPDVPQTNPDVPPNDLDPNPAAEAPANNTEADD